MSERDNLFHALWSKAVGTSAYDKQQWLRFERMLAELNSSTPCARCGKPSGSSLPAEKMPVCTGCDYIVTLETRNEKIMSLLAAACQERDEARGAFAIADTLRKEMTDRANRFEGAERELERWWHGKQIEGDYVCPNELRAINAEAARDAALTDVEMFATATPLDPASVMASSLGRVVQERNKAIAERDVLRAKATSASCALNNLATQLTGQIFGGEPSDAYARRVASELRDVSKEAAR